MSDSFPQFGEIKTCSVCTPYARSLSVMSATPFNIRVRSVHEPESVHEHDTKSTPYISWNNDGGPNLALLVSVLCFEDPIDEMK